MLDNENKYVLICKISLWGEVWVQDAASSIIHRQLGVQWMIFMKKWLRSSFTFRKAFNILKKICTMDIISMNPRFFFSPLSCSSARNKFTLYHLLTSLHKSQSSSSRFFGWCWATQSILIQIIQFINLYKYISLSHFS